MLLSNRSYLKFTLPILYRHLSTIDTQHVCLVNPCRSPSSFPASELSLPHRQESRQISNVSYTPKRSASIRASSTDEPTKTSNHDERSSLGFPPGNPNDKPRLEHLRFIEQQLIRILPGFCKQMHPYGLYTADVIFENYYEDPPKIMKGAGSYAVALFWIRIKLNFKLMNVTVHLLKTTIDEEANCVKIRWRVSGLSNKSFVGVLKGWRKPKDVAGNIRDYIEYIDGLSTFYVRGDGRISKHRVDRVMIDEDKQTASSPLDKKKLAATAPIS